MALGSGQQPVAWLCLYPGLRLRGLCLSGFSWETLGALPTHGSFWDPAQTLSGSWHTSGAGLPVIPGFPVISSCPGGSGSGLWASGLTSAGPEAL